MHRTIHRATLATAALATAGTTLLSLGAPARAATPTRIDAEYWGVSCVTALGDGQTLFLFGGGTTDGAEGGIGAFVEAADGSQVAEGQATAYGFGATFTATVPLGTHTFTVAADATPGPATSEQVDERDGNRWTKGTATHADVALTNPRASYDGAPVVLADGACTAELNGFHVRTTNPTASVSRSSDFGSDICAVTGLADGQVRLSGTLPDTYVEVVLDHGGEDVEKARGDLRVTGGRGTLHTDVVDLFTGEPRTRATIGLDLRRTGSATREVATEGGATVRQTLTPYLATVDVRLADGRRGTARCAAAAVTTQVRVRG